MHTIRVNALIAAFHQGMEYWARMDPVPPRYARVLAYVERRDPVAVTDAVEHMERAG
jgi:hypothetical protein